MTHKILSGNLTTINQILPHKNKWAWDLYIKGVHNHWVPDSISMSDDVQQWRSRTFFTDDERLLVRRCLGFFAGAESLVGNNLLLSLYRYICDGECRQYIGRQLAEELIHNHTIVYICDSLGLEVGEVYEAYKNVPSIKAKDDFLLSVTTDLAGDDFTFYNYPDPADKLWLVKAACGDEQLRDSVIDHCTQLADSCRQQILRNLISYYIICEGIFFYAGFAMLLSIGRQKKLPGVSQQIYYSLRDEILHLEFGTTLINKIIEQEPQIWTEEFREETLEHVRRATELEIAYARDVLPRGILGLNADMFVTYMRYVANLRCDSIGLRRLFPQTPSPFPWLQEMVESRKLKNFFEKHVTEYQAGGGLTDDL